MPQLVIVDPRSGKQRVPLDQPEYIVGRDPGAAIHLQDPKVSRKHARIFLQGAAYWVEDLGSANGVLMAGQAISQPVRLRAGLELDIGGFLFNLEEDHPVPGATFSLVGLTPPCQDQSYLLPSGELSVGRVAGNAIVIADASVSRQHALLIVTPASVVVEDLDSSNGTWVGQVRVGRRALAPGERVRFGNVELELCRASGAVSLGFLARLWGRFARAERPIQIAAVIGAMSAVLLVALVLVAINRVRAPAAVSVSSAGSLEEAYEKGLEDDLTVARTHVQREAWDDALRAFARILDRDPINREARRGLLSAQRSIREQQLLTAARAAIENGSAAEALSQLQQVSAESHYAAAASALAERARATISEAALEEARALCGRKEWKSCHDELVRLLDHRPDSTPGQLLLADAENGMRARRIAFTPWAPLRDDGASPARALESAYADAEVREAARQYAGGDLDEAIKRARTFISRPGAPQLSQQLADFRRAKTAGDGAAMAGDTDRAVAAWEEALTSDARIVPEGLQSALGDELRRRMGVELFRKGDAAFDRGVYSEAFAFWSRGAHYNPANKELLGGLGRLEMRAQAMLDELPARGTLNTEACTRLGEAAAMTRPDSAVHRKAAERRTADCGR